jgi:succinate dehydrogenase (ubiquinone) membrane anchor subunit
MRRTLHRHSLFATRRVASTKLPISLASRPTPIRPAISILSQSTLPAAFHTSSSKAILPAGPQVIEGGINDPAPVPQPSPTHGSYHWTFERALSLGLVPLTLAPFAYGSLNPVMDSVFVAAVLLHSHVGFT